MCVIFKQQSPTRETRSTRSGRPTLSMQLELRHHLNDWSASEESEMKEKAVKRYCTMNEYLLKCYYWKVIGIVSIFADG